MKKLKKVFSKENIIGFIVSLISAASPLFSVYPFGAAAVVSAENGLGAALAGAIVGCLIGEREVFIGILAMLVAYFALVQVKKHRGKATLTDRMLISVGAAAVYACEGLVRGDVLSGVFASVCHIVITPCASFLMYHAVRHRETKNSARINAAMFMCLFVLCSFASVFKINSAPLTLAVGCVLTLAVAHRNGFLFGGAAGFVCGIAAGAPSLGALAVAGMTYGMLHSDSAFLAALLSFMLSLSAYGYLASFEGLVPAAIMLSLSTAGFLIFKKRIPKPIPTARREIKAENAMSLKRFAAAFSSLSGVFFTIGSSVRAPEKEEIYRGISEAVESCCCDCKGCGIASRDISSPLCDCIYEGKTADESLLPLRLQIDCPNVERILSAANGVKQSFDEAGREGLKRLSDEYKSFASLLDSAARREERSNFRDKSGEIEVEKALDELSICRDSIVLRGERIKKLEVYGVQPNSIRVTADALQKCIGGALRQKMSQPVFRLHDGVNIMEMTTSPKLRTESAKYSRAKKNEKVSGDTVSMFETPDKRFCCLISDGMGSGEDASLSSRLSALVLEKLLKLGVETYPALKALNGALVEKQEEVFSTVDLLDADLITATATLTKAGAAPTYFLRNGVCRTLTSATPPMGIMQDVYSESVTLTLQKGDCIILVSDGALPDSGGSYITDLLAGIKDPTAASVVSRISSCAEELAKGQDDLSVCAVRFY